MIYPGDMDVNPITLMDEGCSQYPTPPPLQQECLTSEPPKKKRKAWGQPVPEINKILPPRKRAKTAEEKEQRKNERILRNRKAADKSRQRQKAAVSELEVKALRMEQEMAALRATVAGYQNRFGVQKDLEFDFSVSTHPSDPLSAPTPFSLDDDDEEDTSPMSPSYTFPVPNQQPTLVQVSDPVPIKNESPALGPSLDIKAESNGEEKLLTVSDNSTPALTQYPAVVLCDLQCQAECGPISLSTLPFQAGLSLLLQVISMIFQTYSTTMLSPMYQIFRILEQKSDSNLTEETFPFLTQHFPLIHSLISMPSTPTRPAVFRMKLLSRFLACSPLMARLLLAATDEALQQVVSEEGFVEDPERRCYWASLMTIKWAIIKLEKEHRKVRRRPNVERKTLRRYIMNGVDFRAVKHSSKLWLGQECTIKVVGQSSAQEVH